MDKTIPGKIQHARQLIEQAGAETEIESDGGIRRHTVPQIRAAGSDWIVPGSLMSPTASRKSAVVSVDVAV